MGMKLYILDNGHLECDSNSVVNRSTMANIYDKNMPAQWIKTPVPAAFIDHPKGKILFDTGCNPKALKPGYWTDGSLKNCPWYATPEQDFVHQLSLCGVKPEDIDIVIMSHMHLDHAGNLGLFKNAKVYVQRQEMIEALMVTHTVAPRGTYMREEVDVDVNFQLVDGDVELFDDVKLIFLPGHSSGSMGLQLTLENGGTWLLPGDACGNSGNYGPPAMYASKCQDTKSYVESIEKLRKIANATNATIVFGHDWEAYGALKKAPEFYD